MERQMYMYTYAELLHFTHPRVSENPWLRVGQGLTKLTAPGSHSLGSCLPMTAGLRIHRWKGG